MTAKRAFLWFGRSLLILSITVIPLVTFFSLVYYTGPFSPREVMSNDWLSARLWYTFIIFISLLFVSSVSWLWPRLGLALIAPLFLIHGCMAFSGGAVDAEGIYLSMSRETMILLYGGFIFAIIVNVAAGWINGEPHF